MFYIINWLIIGNVEMKIIQTNTNRSKSAHDLAYLTATELEADVIIACEPNRAHIKKRNWITDKSGDVAVYIRNKRIQVADARSEQGYIILKFSQFSIICGYISPNIQFEAYEQQLSSIMDSVKRQGKILIIGDLNAKAPEWGSPASDRRGDTLLDWISAKDLVVHNTGEPTFIRGYSKSHIDVTLSTQNLARQVINWRVLPKEGLSDHQLICFQVKDNTPKRGYILPRARLEAGILHRAMKRHQDKFNQQENCNPDSCSDILKDVLNSCTTRRVYGDSAPYWWSEEIDVCRSLCTAKRRVLTRCRGGIKQLKDEYKEARKRLRKLIKSSKAKAWDNICAKLEDDIWGDGYRIIRKSLGNPSPPFSLTNELRREILNVMFPTRNDRWISAPTDFPMPFSMEEIVEAGERLKPGTAPGPDAIPPEIVKELIMQAPEYTLTLMNTFLVSQRFPVQWKRAKVVLIGKKGKEPLDPRGYRPICLLNTMAKLYEALIRNRLVREVEGRGDFANNQFGFRKGRSTLQAMQKILSFVKDSSEKYCVMITLDIRNAFNSAPWGKIMAKLREWNISAYLMNIIGSYLSDREVFSGGITKQMTAGVPQGSILGPTLWNILYDDVLKLRLAEGSIIVGFADDIALVTKAKDLTTIDHRANKCLRLVDNWLQNHYLEIAPEKTEAVLLKCPKNIPNELNISIQGVRIEPKKAIKYLGVFMDWQGTFGSHVTYVCNKASEKAAALSRLLPNIGGPSEVKRRMLVGVAQSIILYAAPIWASVCKIKKYENLLISTQRKMLLRATSGYRTTSAAALQTIAGMPPITLLIDERKRLFERQDASSGPAKKEERDRTVGIWQRMWNENTGTAQWTKKLIPDINKWTNCPHRTIDFYLTQVLTGHGCFGSYLHRIGKKTDDICFFCEQSDSPEHSIFHCPRWIEQRLRCEATIGQQLSVGNFCVMMVSSKANWTAIHSLIVDIMKLKSEEERYRE